MPHPPAVAASQRKSGSAPSEFENLRSRSRRLARRLVLVPRRRPAESARRYCIHADAHRPRRAGAPAASKHRFVAARRRCARPDQMRAAEQHRAGRAFVWRFCHLRRRRSGGEQSLLDVVQPAVQEVIQGVLDRRDTTVPVRDAAAFKVNEKDRAWVDSLATPQPIGTMTEKIKLTGVRERVATKAYIRAAGYPNVSFDKACARTKADRSWRTYEVPCGHDVMIDKPDRLAEIL